MDQSFDHLLGRQSPSISGQCLVGHEFHQEAVCTEEAYDHFHRVSNRRRDIELPVDGLKHPAGLDAQGRRCPPTALSSSLSPPAQPAR